MTNELKMTRSHLNYIDLLPKDILIDNIFSRLPIESLGQCKCVSKPWNFTISDPLFIKTHLTKTPKSSKLIFISYRPNFGLLYTAFENNPNSNGFGKRLNFDCSKTWSKLWGSCDGLVLVEDNRTWTNMYLLNPTTMESKQLPILPCLNSKHEYGCVFGLGYDPTSDDYGVVAISFRQYGLKNDACVYVHMIRENKWVNVGLSPYDYRIDNEELGAGIFVGGCLHWLAKNVNDSSSLISAFNIANKEFSQVAVPEGFFGSNITLVRLGVLKGCLCLMKIVNMVVIELWVMEKYGVEESWINFLIDFYKVPPAVSSHFVEDNLVEIDFGGIFLVNTAAEKAGPYKYNQFINFHMDIKSGMTYVESLISPNN